MPALSGVPKKENNSNRAQKRAEMLRHPCCLGDPQQRGQNQSPRKKFPMASLILPRVL